MTPVNLSGGEAAFPFAALAHAAFAGARPDLNRYFVSDLSKIAIPSPGPALLSMVPRLQRRGLLPASLFPARFVHRLLMLGSGATEGFQLVLGVLKADVDAESRRAGRALEPAIVFPVPTYGYFIEAARRRGFTPIIVDRDLSANGALRADHLRDAFAAAERAGQRIAAFYDTNPHNPLGLIRDRAETAALAAVLCEVSALYHLRDVAAAAGERPPWSGPASRVRVIDDLVYDGLEYAGEPQGASFAEIEEIAGDVIVLLGLSKVGLAGLRAGLMIAGPDLIRRAVALQLEASYFPNLPAMKALELFYGDAEPASDWRRGHLDALNTAHRFRGRLMQALIDGMGSVAPQDSAEREAMVASVALHAGLGREAAHARLIRGIPGVNVFTRPRAGFFHMLDLSALRGRRIRLPSGAMSAPIEDETMLLPIEQAMDLHVCFGVWTGLEPSRMLQRVSFAVPEGEIVAAATRLADMLARAVPPVCRSPAADIQ